MAGYGKQVGKLSLRVLPDASKFRADIDKLIERIERTKQIKLEVQADTAKARRELERFHEKWNGEDIKMGLDVGTEKSRAQLTALTRPRTIRINTDLNKTSLAKVAAQVNTLTARLSGLRVAKDVFNEFKESILNLDKSTGKISRLSLSLANLGSSIVSSLGGAVTVLSDALNVGNLGLVLPAAFAGAATGATALVLALKDMTTVLADLGPAIKAIQPVVSKAFWSGAEGPIRDLVNTYLPALSTGMGAVGTALGNQFGTMANAFKSALGNGVFESFFDTLVKTIDIATGAVTPLVQAFVKMGEVGAAFLPDFASWMVDVSNAFNDWVQQAAASGQMAALIEAGARAAQDLGKAAGGIVGIFYAINTAASAAGGTGLSGFAAAMQAASNILNSPEVQNALTTIFTGASEGLGQVGVGLMNFGNTLVALAPTISSILSLAGEALGTLITGISIALDQPAVKEGFTALFEGILKGVQGIVPALPVLFGLFGQLAGIVGSLAAQFGPLLGVLKETFAPVLEAVLSAVEPLIPILGTALRGAISALAGPLQGLAGFMNDNQGAMTALFGVLAVGIPAVIAGVKAWQTYQKAMLLIKAVQQGYQAATYGSIAATYANAGAAKIGAIAFKAWGVATKAWNAITKGAAAVQVAFNAAILANPIGIIIVAILAVIAALVYFFTQTKLGKEIWANFVQFLSEAWANIVAGFNSLVTGFQVGWAAIQAFFATIFDTLMSFFATWGPAILAVIAPFIGIPLLIVQHWTEIVAFLSGIWDAILAGASAVWDLISTAITTVISVMQGIILSVIGAIASGWSNWLSGLQAVASAIWNGILSVIGSVVNGVRSVVVSVINAIASGWSAWLSGLQSTASAIWNAIKSVVTSAINGVRSVVTSVISGISSTWQAGWNAMSAVVGAVGGAIRSTVSGMVSAVSGAISQVGSTLATIKSTVTGAISGAGQWLVESGKSIINGLISGIKSMVSAAGDAIGGVMSKIRGFLPFSPAKEGPFSGKGWTPYSGKALVQGLADGMTSKIGSVRDAARAMTEAASATATVGLDQTGSSLDAAYAQRIAAGVPDYITIHGGVGYDPKSIGAEIALKKKQAALAAGLGMVQVR